MIPRSIGKYDIIDALGIGGMGTVYRGFDTTLERTVAVKVLQLDRGHDVTPQELSARFRNEARAVARLNHPAIVTIFDYDDQDPVGAYIVMEYVNGCALDEYVKKRPELHLEDAVSAMQQVLAGLAYAHRQGVIHRDIKPSNLLVTREGAVKITDFGIAKIGPRSQTQSGLIVGTPQYMAPEQYMGGVVDHRCDIHAAGAVLYELLTGSPPFQGGAAEVMYKVCHEVPKPVSSVNRALPQVFDAVVGRALSKSAANSLHIRYRVPAGTACELGFGIGSAAVADDVGPGQVDRKRPSAVTRSNQKPPRPLPGPGRRRPWLRLKHRYRPHPAGRAMSRTPALLLHGSRSS